VVRGGRLLRGRSKSLPGQAILSTRRLASAPATLHSRGQIAKTPRQRLQHFIPVPRMIRISGTLTGHLTPGPCLPRSDHPVARAAARASGQRNPSLARDVRGEGADGTAGRVEERQGNLGAGRAVRPFEVDAEASGLPSVERDVHRRRGRAGLDPRQDARHEVLRAGLHGVAARL
jgi:hypothetical protein